MPPPEQRLRAEWLEVVRATFVRDLRVAVSYRVGFALSLAGSVLNVLGVYFLSRAFGDTVSESLGAYGASYLGFAVVGVALSTFMAVGLTGIGSTIREGQLTGTLELMILSPNRLGVLLLSSSIWPHTLAGINLAVYIASGVILGMDISRANVPVAVVSFVLAVISFNALGLIAASVVIVIKQGNPVSLVVGLASGLLAGVLYPVSVLPPPLQAAGQLLPLTHALELLRRSVLAGEGIETLWPSLLAMLVLTAALLPAGLWICGRAVRIAQTDGSLSQY